MKCFCVINIFLSFTDDFCLVSLQVSYQEEKEKKKRRRVTHSKANKPTFVYRANGNLTEREGGCCSTLPIAGAFVVFCGGDGGGGGRGSKGEEGE